MNPYLLGDMYWIQPIQPGKSALFLKNPAKRMIGKINIGTTADTDLGSKMILPNNNPNDAPLKAINIKTRQCMKNCPPVFAKSIIK